MRETIGEEYLIPLLEVLSTPEDLSLKDLPSSFILKSNHGSGWVYICRDKINEDETALKAKINAWLRTNYYDFTREWPYKDVVPKVLIEEFLTDPKGSVPKDYKIFCFNGEPKQINVDFDRFGAHKRNIYDLDWNLLEFGMGFPRNQEIDEPKPHNLDEMLDIAKKLSAGLKFVRVDLYNLSGKIYFGELTFYPARGLGRFDPFEYDQKIGELLSL